MLSEKTVKARNRRKWRGDHYSQIKNLLLEHGAMMNTHQLAATLGMSDRVVRDLLLAAGWVKAPHAFHWMPPPALCRFPKNLPAGADSVQLVSPVGEFALISSIDLNWATAIKWMVDESGGPLHGMVVDYDCRSRPLDHRVKRRRLRHDGSPHVKHLNGNPLDCRRENLVTLKPGERLLSAEAAVGAALQVSEVELAFARQQAAKATERALERLNGGRSAVGGNRSAAPPGHEPAHVGHVDLSTLSADPEARIEDRIAAMLESGETFESVVAKLGAAATPELLNQVANEMDDRAMAAYDAQQGAAKAATEDGEVGPGSEDWAGFLGE